MHFLVCVLAPWRPHMNLIWTNTMWVAICCFCETSILGSLNLTIDDFYFLLCKRCISFWHEWELTESKVLPHARAAQWVTSLLRLCKSSLGFGILGDCFSINILERFSNWIHCCSFIDDDIRWGCALTECSWWASFLMAVARVKYLVILICIT